MPNYAQDFVENVPSGLTPAMDENKHTTIVIIADQTTPAGMVQALRVCPDVKSLTCRNLRKDTIEPIMTAMNNCKINLSTLRIEDSVDFEEADLFKLVMCPSIQLTLQHLYLGPNSLKLAESGGEALYNSLRVLPALTKLTCDQMMFGLRNVMVLVAYLEEGYPLQELVLKNCMQDDVAQYVAFSLANTVHLRLVQLTGAMVGPQTATALANVMRETKTISWFSIMDHEIPPRILDSMLDAFRSNYAIKECSPTTIDTVHPAFQAINQARFDAE